MCEYYLRVEGVNLDSVLSDTSQLSVIRGSSLLLREATVALGGSLNASLKEKKPVFSIQLTPIATGASTGLYAFEAESEDAPKLLLSEVSDWLNKHYQDFTFVVDFIKKSNDFKVDINQLINKNRYQQLQQVSLALPETIFKNCSPQVACALDGIRPASSQQHQKEYISASVARRLRFGREKRQNFYVDELAEPQLAGLDFTDDLASLAYSKNYANLNQKIAVLYFDGNSFGKLQQKYCNTAEKRREFDESIAKWQGDFLRKLLNQAKTDPEFMTENQKIRLEVLMWGGDEVLLVVPAWKGIATLQLFYESIKAWRFPENTSEKNSDAMTYAGGVVFSQANTPIFRLRNIAKELAENAKVKSRDNNLFDYLVLESLDYPSESLTQLRKRQYQDKAEGRTLLMPLDQEQQAKLYCYIKEDSLPKSQVMLLAHTAIQATNADFEEAHERLLALIKQYDVTFDVDSQLEQLFKKPESGDVKDMFARFLKGTLSDSITIWPWIHLAELWDYLFIDSVTESSQEGK